MTETDILIVEDDKDIATVLGDFLRAKGYVVSIASDGKKALALYERYGAGDGVQTRSGNIIPRMVSKLTLSLRPGRHQKIAHTLIGKQHL